MRLSHSLVNLILTSLQDSEFQSQLEKKRKRLAMLLMHDIQSPSLHKSEHKLLITCLVNLGLSNVARDLYLGIFPYLNNNLQFAYMTLI